MSTVKSFIKKHPVVTYFALTFAISWGGALIMVGPRIPATREEFERVLPVAISAMLVGPSIAGILLTGLVYGKAGLRELRSRLLKSTSPEAVVRLLGESQPRLMVTDPPYGIELDSEWRDRGGLNGPKTGPSRACLEVESLSGSAGGCHGKAIYLIALLIIIPVLYPVVWAIRSVYRRYCGTRLVTCPETHQAAAVRVNARQAVMTALAGHQVLELQKCSLWPGHPQCGQECLRQIEAAAEACFLRDILAHWYEGK